MTGFSVLNGGLDSYNDSLYLTANDVGDGVKFTFSLSDGAGIGKGTAQAGEFYFDANPWIFSGAGAEVLLGGKSVDATLAVSTAEPSGFGTVWGTTDHLLTLSLGNGNQGWNFNDGVEFTLFYADGFGWDDFMAADNFMIGFHLIGDVLKSAGMVSGAWGEFYPGPEPGDGASTPEPATLALMGLGLAGVGAAARRRAKK